MVNAPSIWPTEKEIVHSLAWDFAGLRAAEQAGRPPRIVPGFEGLRVDGIVVGEWLTYDQLLGEGGPDIAAVRFVNEKLEGIIVYYKSGLRERHEAYEVTLKAESSAAAAARRRDPEKQVENAIADARRAAGHTVRQQVKTPAGIADIVDDTEKLIIECKASSKTTYVMHAVDQLDRYVPHFDGYGQALGLPDKLLNPATMRALCALKISILTPAAPLRADARPRIMPRHRGL